MSYFFYLFKQAWASLKKKPGFVATVVVTMGTTLGALLCVLTLAYLLILQPLPYPEQDKLYNVVHVLSDQSGEIQGEAFTYPGLLHLYKNQTVFEKATLIDYEQEVLGSLPHQPTLNTAYVTPEWFELLAAPMLMGRLFDASEGADTFNPMAILSYQTWRDEFDSRGDILEQKVSLRGVSFRVIGVLAKSFVEPQIKHAGLITGIWLSWDYNYDADRTEQWIGLDDVLTFVGKLKEGLTVEQAEQVITPLVNDTWVEHVASTAFFRGWSINMQLQPFQTVILGDSTNTVYLLLAGVLGLVLIAFANIANLFMLRTAEQQRQLAICAAIGAKKHHLFRGLLVEACLLMGLSILLALVIATGGFHLLQHYLTSVLPRVAELSFNAATFVFAAALTLVLAFLFAFLSSKMINYRALNSSLQSSGKGTGVQVSKRFRQVLVVSQITISTVLVFANISLFKEAVATINQPSGFAVDNMTHLNLSVSAQKAPSNKEMAPVMTEIRKKLLSLPQVESISQSSSALDDFFRWTFTVVATNENVIPESKEVSYNYFTFFAQPLIEGNYFSESARQDGKMVMVVNDVFAKHINPDGSALGMKISTGGPDAFTIVGVVKGVLMPTEQEVPLRTYIPSSLATTEMTLKLHAGQSINRQEVVTIINEVSSLYKLFSLEKLSDIRRQKLFTQYTTAITTAVLTIITLFLACIGLYGILSYGTQMRRFELGTRMAIGAKRQHLIRLIVKDNAWSITLGMAISVFVMLALYIAYKAEFATYISFRLWPVFLITVIAITLLSLFACYWPLRKYINQPAIHSLRGSD
jgi:predicted permease